MLRSALDRQKPEVTGGRAERAGLEKKGPPGGGPSKRWRDRIRSPATFLAYGVSTRTMVGSGRPSMPEYATDPRYLVPRANPLNVRPIVPVPPRVAVAGALTDMLPEAVEPSAHENSVKLDAAEPAGTPKPWT